MEDEVVERPVKKDKKYFLYRMVCKYKCGNFTFKTLIRPEDMDNKRCIHCSERMVPQKIKE